MVGDYLGNVLILLIDGYNFLKNTSSELHIKDSVRVEFISKLSSYSRKKNHQVIVVFDGGDSPFPLKDAIKGVTVIYSGYKRSADEVIKDYLDENKGKEILLVSSDRDLQKFSKNLNLDFISVSEFYSIFSYQKNSVPVKKDDTLYKTTGKNSPELDELMIQEMGRVFEKEEDFINSSEDVSLRKTSKGQKRIFDKIKKL